MKNDAVFVTAICICPVAGKIMQEVEAVEAIAGFGLKGDRYASGGGSFNKGKPGERQVTLINDLFIDGSGFEYVDTRRNISVRGTELMYLIGREFDIDEARMRGIKYCDPCERPNTIAGNSKSFKATFFDRGGLIADVVKSGWIRRGSLVVPPKKGY
jgi:hypothetical protein